MSSTAESTTRKAGNSPVAQHPFWAVPTVLAILMLSSGGFVVLLAHGISIFSSIRY